MYPHLPRASCGIPPFSSTKPLGRVCGMEQGRIHTACQFFRRYIQRAGHIHPEKRRNRIWSGHGREPTRPAHPYHHAGGTLHPARLQIYPERHRMDIPHRQKRLERGPSSTLLRNTVPNCRASPISEARLPSAALCGYHLPRRPLSKALPGIYPAPGIRRGKPQSNLCPIPGQAGGMEIIQHGVPVRRWKSRLRGNSPPGLVHAGIPGQTSA